MIKILIVLIMMFFITSCSEIDTLYQISNLRITNFEQSTDQSIGALYKITGINSLGKQEIAYLGNSKAVIRNEHDQKLGVCFTMIGFKDLTSTDKVFKVSNYYPVPCPLMQ